MAENLDELFQELEQFELEGATKLTPREYARLREMSPQLVYYYIRNGVIEKETCACGRSVVDIENTDKALEEKKEARGKRV